MVNGWAVGHHFMKDAEPLHRGEITLLRAARIHPSNSRYHQLVGATHKSLPRSVAEFFWAFLIYIDLPPSADPFERSAAIAREEFGLIHVEALGVYYRAAVFNSRGFGPRPSTRTWYNNYKLDGPTTPQPSPHFSHERERLIQRSVLISDIREIAQRVAADGPPACLDQLIEHAARLCHISWFYLLLLSSRREPG